MQYVMLVRVDPDLPAPNAGHDADAWVEEGARTGMRIEGGPVGGADDATTVRVEDGETVVSDGPFAETKEVVAGWDLLEAASLEQAIDYATRHPVADYGALEIREVWSDFVPDPDGGLPEPVETGTDYLFLHAPQWEKIRGMRPEDGDPTAWVREVEQRRAALGGFRLRIGDADTAATVRRRDGETIITRGPFTETVEEIAGIDRLRVPDLDEAIALAAAHPTARIGSIEIRPFQRV